MRRRWIKVDKLIRESTKQSLLLYDIDFTNWQYDINFRSDFRLAKVGDSWSLRPFAENQSTFQFIKGNYSFKVMIKYRRLLRLLPLQRYKSDNQM